jgi:GNAT superfamily N-acetyltransferase
VTQNHGINIIRAQPHMAPMLSEVAIAAKSYWRYPAHWIEQWRTQLTIKPEYVRDNDVYATVNQAEQIVGWYAVAGTGAFLVLDNLWVRPDHIGTGVGRMLLEHAVAHAAARGADTLELEADPHAAGFYERMGMQCVGAKAAAMDGLERCLPIFVMKLQHKEHDS